MAPDQQRIAIAEACPGLFNFHPEYKWLFWDGNCWVRCLRGGDILSDLNAMHEAERMLADENTQLYYDKLFAIQRHQFGLVTDRQFQMIHATPAQRAEAFLRTLNLWTE